MHVNTSRRKRHKIKKDTRIATYRKPLQQKSSPSESQVRLRMIEQNQQGILNEVKDTRDHTLRNGHLFHGLLYMVIVAIFPRPQITWCLFIFLL